MFGIHGKLYFPNARQRNNNKAFEYFNSDLQIPCNPLNRLLVKVPLASNANLHLFLQGLKKAKFASQFGEISALETEQPRAGGFGTDKCSS